MGRQAELPVKVHFDMFTYINAYTLFFIKVG